MFKRISNTITYPVWVQSCPRFKALDLRDRLLYGTFYDNLQFGFYEETHGDGTPIPIAERRPSVQYRLPRMVARWCARKLFSGRHIPKIRHPSKDLAKGVMQMAARTQLFRRMREVVLRGSVGSVAVTFCCEQAGDGPAGVGGDSRQKIALSIWQAKYCDPTFDPYGELVKLRVQYVTSLGAMRALGWEGDKSADANSQVWFIRDFGVDREVTYQPPRYDEWDPVNGFVMVESGSGKKRRASERELLVWDDKTCEHGFGFVPAHWFVNLEDGSDTPTVDGVATFEDAIPNSIELDYQLSQTGRGVRYNSAPQLVIVGDILNGEEVTRGPMAYIHLKAGWKDENGQALGEGRAELLEMKGTGTTAALAYIDKLRNAALEQIAASRKDPDKMHAPLSGRAMEYLDQDSDDLVMDLRSQYGEHGLLPLLRKMCIATGVLADPSQLTLQWPRLVQLTPDEINALVQAFAMAMNPVQVPGPSGPATKSADGSTVPGKPGPPMPSEEHQLITPEEARAYLSMVLDLTMLDMETGEDPDDTEPEGDGEPGEENPAAPSPTPIDELPPINDGQGVEPERSAAELAGFQGG